MIRRCILTLLLVLAAHAPDGLAGPFSRKPNRPEPSEYVPSLLKTLQSEPDERKRETAAGELRDYDAKTFPDISKAHILLITV